MRICKLLCTVSGVNYYINSNCTKYMAQTVTNFFYNFEKFHCKFVNLVAQSTDGTTKSLVR